MNLTTYACPFCNAVLPALAAPPAGDKLPCPRCGELVPAARWHVSTAIASGEPNVKPPEPPREQVPGNRKTAVIVVSVMVTMAVIGLSFMLWTIKERRARDPKPALDPVTLCKPLELTGLAYLPKDCHFIVGLHLAEWLDDKKVGKPLLDEPRPMLLDFVLKQLPRMTGLPIEEIDHVVVAGWFDKPHVVMVMKTRRRYALEKIAEQAHRSKTPQHQDRAVYEMSLPPWAEALVWCVEEKTIVCVISLKEAPNVGHLNGLSATPRKLDEVLPGPLHEAIKVRLPRRPFVWGVARLDKAELPKDMPPLAQVGLAMAKEVKTVAFGLEPVEGLTLRGEFQMSSAKAAGDLKTLLEALKIDGAKSQKVEVPPAKEPEQWLTWQVRGDVATMRAWLSKDAKK